MKEIFSSCLCQEIDLKEQVKDVYLFISMKMYNLIDYLSGARCISAIQAPERIDSWWIDPMLKHCLCQKWVKSVSDNFPQTFSSIADAFICRDW